MTQLHFDCFSGISGDMTLGALVDVGLPFKDLARALRGVPVQGYSLRSTQVKRGALHATKVDVVIREGFRSPFSLRRIHRMIATSRVPAKVKEQSRDVFERLARAEGLAHRISPSDVRFHEVGVVDSLVDVIGSLLGCDLLGMNRITASPVNLGSGLIESSHGTLPAPGPAVAALARGVPVYSNGPHRELTTPTGMALLRTLVEEFTPLPLMRPSAIGHGAGDADTGEWPNVLRVFVGEPEPLTVSGTEVIVEIETNLDDLNPQVYDTIIDRLLKAGALDVTLTPVIMKHGRPGIILSALASPTKARQVSRVMLDDTSTLGVRMKEMSRSILPRRLEEVRLTHGSVRVKVAELGQGRTKATPEYQDCKRIAERTGRPVRDVLEEAALAYRLRDRKVKVKRQKKQS
jgi:uncharacterized protein (TIGR00299 family) protein